MAIIYTICYINNILLYATKTYWYLISPVIDRITVSPLSDMKHYQHPVRIYFLGLRSGRKPTFTRPRTRYFFKLEEERKGERAGLAQVKTLKRTNFRHKANIVFFRNRPELTTDKYYAELKAKADRLPNDVLQINPISSFYNHSNKIRTFKLWQKAGIPCPEFVVLPAEADLDDCYQITHAFIKRHDAILLRTNNEAVGDGIYNLDSNASEEQIIRVLKILRQRIRQLKLTRSDSCIMAVKVLKKDVPLAEARVYVVSDKLLIECSMGRIVPTHIQDLNLAQQANYHNFDNFSTYPNDARKTNIKLIHEANYALKQRLLEDPQLIKLCIQAVSVLGNNIGAIDLLFSKNRPVFLEINPMFGFGETDLMGLPRKDFNATWDITSNEAFFKRVYSIILETYLSHGEYT